MNKQKNRIVSWFTSLSSTGQLFATIIGVVILVILVKLIGSLDLNKKIINYKTLSGAYAIENLQTTNDRDVYMKANDIVEKMLFATVDQYTINEKNVKTSDYFKYTKYHEYRIPLFKFNKVMKNISADVFKDINTTYLTGKEIYPVIKNIYVLSFDYNMYICELNTDEPHFIGIQLDGNEYYIIYVE